MNKSSKKQTKSLYTMLENKSKTHGRILLSYSPPPPHKKEKKMDWSTDFYDHIHGFLSMVTALSKIRKRKEGGGRKEGTRTNLWSSTNQTK